jgi:thioredoxin reductase (NADPH)
MPQEHDLTIIGTGITGLNAARQALQDGLSVATIEALFFGGLVTNVNELDGQIQGSGIDLAAKLMMEISDLGAENITACVSAIEPDGDLLVVKSDAGDHRTRAVIIASGARLKRLGIPGEAEFEERGVAHCADCDGPLYSDQDVVVVGGGDSALQEALVLAEFARRVHLVHRGAQFDAQPHLIEKINGQANITIHWRTQVDAVLGGESVQAARVLGPDGAPAVEIRCTGFFAYVGLEPACDFVPDAVLRDPAGFVLTDPGLRTAMPGIFAAGAARSGYGGLLTHAAAEGIAAAKSAGELIRGRAAARTV